MHEAYYKLGPLMSNHTMSKRESENILFVHTIIGQTIKALYTIYWYTNH